MKKYYISNMESESGIAKYSRDFYNLILKDLGYKYVKSDLPLSEVLSLVTSRDIIHLELGVFQKNEIEILFSMIRANYSQVSITLHDAPLIKYPFHEFNNPLLNIVSKIYDRSGQTKYSIQKIFMKIKNIYVLTNFGVSSLQKKFQLSNVRFLPHVINPHEITREQQYADHLLFFGFVGKNKGVDYALKVHRSLLDQQSQLQFYVIGKPLGRQVSYYETLKKKYSRQVKYLGYLPDNQVGEIFKQAGFAILPFQNYRFFHPFSGSVLYSLKKGTIVFASPHNSIPELIEDGVNGFFLTGNIQADKIKILQVMADKKLQQQIRNNNFRILEEKHHPSRVLAAFNSSQYEILSTDSKL